jgi:hypothetical protein
VTHADQPLRAAYLATAYRVTASPLGPFEIRCGGISTTLDALLDAAGCEAWAFISACNPGSVLLEAEVNRRRHAALLAEVRQRGLTVHPGLGSGDAGDWPPEESLLVLGLDEAAAVALGHRFGQRAIVVGTRGTAARLVWIDPPLP